MTKPQHTLVPWYAYEPQKDNGEIVITRDCSYDNKRLCKVLPVSPVEADTIANAAFIVKAVNCHDELVEALKSAMANLRHHSGNRPDFEDVFATELATISKAEGK